MFIHFFIQLVSSKTRYHAEFEILIRSNPRSNLVNTDIEGGIESV